MTYSLGTLAVSVETKQPYGGIIMNIRKPRTALFIFGGIMILISFLSSFFYVIVSHRSAIDAMRNEVVVTAPITTDIYFSAEGNYLAYYPAIFVGSHAASDKEVLKELELSLTNKTTNDVVEIKSSEGRSRRSDAWAFKIKTPGTYVLNIDYPHNSGMRIEVRIRPENSRIYIETGFIISGALFITGTVLLLTAALKKSRFKLV